MTQQRHIEAAEKIVEDLIVNGGFVLQRYKSAKMIALALAEAENRAAEDADRFAWLLKRGVAWGGCYDGNWQPGEFIHDIQGAREAIDNAMKSEASNG